ncbi:MAG: hypothetical protein IH987_19035 [Planctomycetes bacterium]|nr:hypothetical protein [Planctomycetota bacterium]
MPAEEAPTSECDKSLDGIAIFDGILRDGQPVVAARCAWNTDEAGPQFVGHIDTSRQVFFLVEGEAGLPET